MDVVGSEIGQKMRSAIKAKLTELGCYVDDELPDYVMVMVANKRTRSQMDEDLQLFLGDNTELFVNWLHQVLKKLQEVTVTAPLEGEQKEKSKDKKSKDKKDKSKSKKLDKLDSVKEKKLKKKGKDKEKSHKKKDKAEKKGHKSKKKSKHHGMIRPNIPPLLMNIEKESEPSITDVFAGQILKNHGVILDTPKTEIVETKPVIPEIKRLIKPIIDPATITQPDVETLVAETTQSEETQISEEVTQISEEVTQISEEVTQISEEVTQVSEETTQDTSVNEDDEPVIIGGAPREEQIKEINEIEAKIQGLKQKLAEQLDSMSDDEDFLNIRTEAEELMNDFAEDVFQEISAQAPPSSPPKKPPTPPKQTVPKPMIEKEVLPLIELNLPKRPIRERLGVKSVSDIDREVTKKVPEVTKKVPEVTKKVLEEKDTARKEKEVDKRRTESPERFTPEKEPDFWPKSRSAKSRLGTVPERRRRSHSDDSDKSDGGSRRHSSRKSSIVVVRPRGRVSSASALLLRAVADAHKSLHNAPPKMNHECQPVKQAKVLPMRRCVDPQKIVIQVKGEDRTGADDTDRSYKMLSATDGKEEYVPAPLTKKFHNTDYVPSRRPERTSSRKDDSLVIETINIHNTTVDKDKDTQFIVTMDGFNPNAFLAKKLQTEGLLNDEDELVNKPIQTKPVLRTKDTALKNKTNDKSKETEKNSQTKDSHNSDTTIVDSEEKSKDKDTNDKETEIERTKTLTLQNKRLSNTSDESDTQVIIKQESKTDRERNEKRNDVEKRKSSEDLDVSENSKSKKRKASPIVFDMKKEKANKERARTESASSDNHVTIVTTAAANKYDAVPPLSAAVVPPPVTDRPRCRSFPQCQWGAGCMFQHPRCKFGAACTRRACVYSHPPKAVASHVVPVANFKSITPAALPSICKYYPNCANPACHFYHPKPCRYGKACVNKLECNFYHSDLTSKFRYPV